MSEKFKFSKKYIIISLLNWLAILLIFSGPFVSNFVFFKEHKTITILVIVALILLSIAIPFLSWKTKSFYVTDSEIIYSYGIIFKNKVSVRFDKISNIKIQRNLIDLIFGISKLNFNSGSVVSAGSEIKLVLDRSYADVLKNYFDYILKNPQEHKVESFPRPQKYSLVQIGKAECKEFSLKQKILMPLLSSGSLLIILSIVTVLFILLFFGKFQEISPEETSFELDFTRFNSSYLGWKILGIIALELFVYIIRVVALILKYYNFSIVRNKDQIHLKHGLINQKNYTININKINAVIIKQSILQRIFKYAELNLSFVGNFMGDNSNKESIPTKELIPMIKIARLKPFMQNYLDEFFKEIEVIKPKRHRMLHFIWIPMLLILIPEIFINIIFVELDVPVMVAPAISIAIFVLVLIGQLLMMFNAGLGYNNDLILVSNGSYIKNTYIIKKSAIQHIETIAGPIRRKQNLCGLIIRYREALSFVSAKHYDLDLAKKLENDLCSD